jgi:predicted phosphoribosyltransferase
MNFIDRISLGDALALRLQQFRDKDAIIICLQESSLMTCLTIASQLRAWLYPLVYEPVYATDGSRRLLGAYGPDGIFCPLPERHTPVQATVDRLQKPGHASGKHHGHASAHKAKATADSDDKAIKKQKAEATKAVEKRLSAYGVALDIHQLDGRDVILVADVLTDGLPLEVAHQVLRQAKPRSLTAAAGNTTPEVADTLRRSAGTTEIMDVLSGVTFDHERYFEHRDSYTPEQQYALAQHIAAYWQ